MRWYGLRRGLIGTAVIVLPVFAMVSLMKAHSESAVAIDPPKLDAQAPASSGLQTAVIAGGCFWGIQAVYQHTKGVTNAVSGYAGGAKKDAEYLTVAYGRSGHAEAVQITYDPRIISYGKILQIFFSVAHNPTELDRQGPDFGPQYRSEIFPQSDEQRKIATAYIAQLDAAGAFPDKIVTKINAGKATFYPAEAYHQDYALKHPDHPYIMYNDAPKVENFKRLFAGIFRDKPVTVAAR
jgi:peptide-methionine (S)-S-oxide reductase